MLRQGGAGLSPTRGRVNPWRGAGGGESYVLKTRSEATNTAC